jgi:hypothetical protein
VPRVFRPFRFKTILRYLRLDTFSFDDRLADPWVPIRRFVGAFNRRLVHTVHLGTDVCIDESMSKWRGAGGKDGYHALRGLPHITKIIRCAAHRPPPAPTELTMANGYVQQTGTTRLGVVDPVVCKDWGGCPSRGAWFCHS